MVILNGSDNEDIENISEIPLSSPNGKRLSFQIIVVNGF
jgi:hypothetical protein